MQTTLLAAMTQQADGKVLLGGGFTIGTTPSTVVRLGAGGPTLTFLRQSGNVLRFDVQVGFKLQKVLSLGDPWEDVNGSSPIDVPMADERGIFRLSN